MGMSKYPRRGQRIAPASLRDILNVPIPEKYSSVTRRFAQLADLDETVWVSANTKTCLGLAELVVQRVRHNPARLPVGLKVGVLAECEREIPLQPLSLDLRTYNSLKNRFGENVPSNVEVRDLLRIRGFGVHCLVDFLAGLESYASRPRQLVLPFTLEKPSPLSPAELPSEISVVISRYPRPGHRLVPKTLKNVLTGYVGGQCFGRTPFSSLDESVWDKYPNNICRELGLKAIRRTHKSLFVIKNMTGVFAPMPKTYGKPLILQLEKRTYNCLLRRGYIEDPGLLAQISLSDLLAIRGMGVRSFVDLLTSLESQVCEESPKGKEVDIAARKMLKVKAATKLQVDDPRFGLALQGLRVSGKTLEDVSRNIIASTQCPMPSKLFAQRINGIHGRILAAERITLENELIELLSVNSKVRNSEIAARHYGWDGKGGTTLEALGREYGMTRERIRQIAQPHLNLLHGKYPYLPVLDQVLDVISRHIPCAEKELKALLVSARLTDNLFNISGIIHAAEATGRNPPFLVESVYRHNVIVPIKAKGLAKQIALAARKAVSHYGATTVADVAAVVGDVRKEVLPGSLITEIITTLPYFSWLDASSGWFWFNRNRRNPLLNDIEKIMSVCARIHAAELRSGVSRLYRREGFAPPQRVLLALCSQAGGYKVDGGCVSAVPALDSDIILGETERLFVAVFRENGPLLELHKLKDECLRRGMNSHTFWMYLSNSPVIARYAPCVYGLRGADVPPGLAESIALVPNKNTRVLADYGWDPEDPGGKIFLNYELSAAVISNGVVSVPMAMTKYISGRYELRVFGSSPIGELVVKGSRAWGLSKLFSRRGGEPGDTLRLLFDLQQQYAIAEMGDVSADEEAETKEEIKSISDHENPHPK